MTFEEAFALCPLVAILRGIRPDEVAAHGEVLRAAGFRIMEIPLNSPDPLESIARAVRTLGNDMAIGAGTVITVAEVEAVAGAGGVLAVSPNTDAGVIGAARARGIEPLPGFATATEAFAAHAAGARSLKLFPAVTYGPAHLRSLSAVLPPDVRVLPVGGVGPAQMAEWRAAGAAGFGLGSELYRAGQAPQVTAEAARRALAA